MTVYYEGSSQLAMDSKNPMEPEHDDFLPDCDFVTESSNGNNVPDELIQYVHVILLKRVWKVSVFDMIPLLNMATFCYYHNNTIMYTKANHRL